MACHFGCLKCSFEGDIDMDEEIGVGIDSYLGCLKGGFKVS